jgi:hypothetical protein
MSNSSIWLGLAFANREEFEHFLRNPGSLRLSQVTHTQDFNELMSAVTEVRPSERQPIAIVPEPSFQRRPRRNRTIKSVVEDALEAQGQTGTGPFKVGPFAKRALASAGIKCSQRNLKNVSHVVMKMEGTSGLRRISRGIYTIDHGAKGKKKG